MEVRSDVSLPPFDPPLIGDSPLTRFLREITVRAAHSDAPVLIEGESGTGKEVVARNIHRLSARVPETLLQSELFGYVRGTFTGALADRRGLIEDADGGVFFLDEIGELPTTLQASLLRVVQEKEVRRIGESRRRRVNVRFLFATNRNLRLMVSEGGFRQDLYYRISCIRICVPPLRERKEDIELLCDYFAGIFSSCYGTVKPVLPHETLEFLKDYDWPGNVRELRNELERIISLYGDMREVTPELFSFYNGGGIGRCPDHDFLSSFVPSSGPSHSEGEGESAAFSRGEYCGDLSSFNPGGKVIGASTLKEAVERLERAAIISALKVNRWNKSRTASSLGITRQGLLKKMRRYGIERDEN